MEFERQPVYFTASERDAWPDGDKWELIDGLAYAMAPPSSLHQAVAGELFFEMKHFLQGKPCVPYFAPFGVYLNAAQPSAAETRKDDTVVEPDITVICDESKISKRGCEGAPDLVVEILSPSTRDYDLYKKTKLYLEYGVREYWIVDPDERYVFIYTLVNGQYLLSVCGPEATLTSTVLIGLRISIPALFQAAGRNSADSYSVAANEAKTDVNLPAIVKNLLKLGLTPTQISEALQVDLTLVEFQSK